MFDDSNGSFEIPETQPDPPRDDQAHDSDVDMNSGAFVAIPDEEMPSNVILQSQCLLGEVSLLDAQVNVTHDSDKTTKSKGIEHVESTNNCTFEGFDDCDENIDLEMSKLEWNDTGKMEENCKSASVTPDLDCDFLSSTKVTRNDNDKSAAVTPDLNFDLTTNAVVNHSLPESSVRDRAKDVEISSDMAGKEIEINDQIKSDGDDVLADTTQVFTKPAASNITKNSLPIDVKTEETELFVKPVSSVSTSKKIHNEDEIINLDDDLEETQLFMKSSDLNEALEVDKINDVIKNEAGDEKDQGPADAEVTDKDPVTTDTNVVNISAPNGEIKHTDYDDDDDNEYDVATERFEVKKSIKRIIISLDEEEAHGSTAKTVKPNELNTQLVDEVVDEYSLATQLFPTKMSSDDVQASGLPDKEDRENETKDQEAVGADNDNDEFDTSTPEIKMQKSKSRKRNRLISSSDEEDNDAGRQTPIKIESLLSITDVMETNEMETNEAAQTSVKIQSDAFVSKALED